MSLPHSRVLVVGLDGATLDLVEPWVQAGYLPTFSRLMEEGVYGTLQSTIPPMTAPAWTSFMTGKNPGKHGLYDWIRRQGNSYGVSPLTAANCHEPVLWSLLSSAGRRVCILNVPMTFPPSAVNGVLISGLPAPSTKVPIAYPPDLLEEIEGMIGEYLLYPDPGQAYSDSGVDAFLENLYRTTATRFRTLAYLRSKEDWDFCMVVINGTDTVQHAMWKYMSADHPLHRPDKGEKYGDAILQYYQYMDKALNRIVSGLDQDTTLVIMSDHGFGPFHRFIHVNNWLRQEGWLQIKGGRGASFKASLFELGFTPMRVYNLLMRLGLGAFKREVVRGRGQGFLKRLFLSFDDVDWERTKVYSLGNVGQISLNVRGREPQGCVEPGEPYEALRNEIISRLYELRDPDTGEAVVEAAYRREEVYQGPNLERAADIVFIPTRMEYFGFGEYEFGSNQVIEPMTRGISGTHRLDGMALLWGGAATGGKRLEDAQIIDLAPTILRILGVPVPEDMDGQVWTQALDPAYSSEQPTQDFEAGQVPLPVSNAAGGPDGDDDVEYLTDEEKELVAARLRGLGYVG